MTQPDILKAGRGGAIEVLGSVLGHKARDGPERLK